MVTYRPQLRMHSFLRSLSPWAARGWEQDRDKFAASWQRGSVCVGGRAGGSPQWPTKVGRAREVEVRAPERPRGRQESATHSPRALLWAQKCLFLVSSEKTHVLSVTLSTEGGQLWTGAWPAGPERPPIPSRWGCYTLGWAACQREKGHMSRATPL